MSEEFWLRNPYVLLNKKYIHKLYPRGDYTQNEKLNAMTRLILLLTILAFFITRNIYFILVGVVSIVFILAYHRLHPEKKENFGLLQNIEVNTDTKERMKKEFYNPRKNNPLMNVLLPEIQYIPDRKPAVPVHNEEVKKQVNEKTMEGLNAKIFRDLGDDILFNQGMRDFYTNPATTIPNDQDSFMQFCYGAMKSCKEGNEDKCDSRNYRHILR